jgi:hypothetical protein
MQEGHLPKDGIKVITPRFQAKMSSSSCVKIFNKGNAIENPRLILGIFKKHT